MKRTAKGTGGALLAILGVLVLPTGASADHDTQVIGGPVPQEILAEFSNCPPPESFSQGFDPFICIKVSAYDGELKLGNTVANVDEPIDATVGVGISPSFATEIVTGGPGAPTGPRDPLADLLDRFGACNEGVRISGGILGVPQLDPILDADSLGVLCLSASPQLGSPTVGDGSTLAALAFLAYLSGIEDPEPTIVTLGLPISIRLNNLLFGRKCQIGSPQLPFVINLTNGATMPPPGVEPLTGSTGPHRTIEFPDANGALYAEVSGSRFVDNAFAVPGAKGCDVLLGDLLSRSGGLFDSTINRQVGLPAGAGRNRALFSLDTDTINYAALQPPG